MAGKRKFDVLFARMKRHGVIGKNENPIKYRLFWLLGKRKLKWLRQRR